MLYSLFAISFSAFIACSSPSSPEETLAVTAAQSKTAVEQTESIDSEPKGEKGQEEETKAVPDTQKVAASEPIPPELLAPKKADATAPATYKVRFKTTKGEVLIQVNRDWAPQGADRFYNLVKIGYFSDVAFFRAIKRFMVQFGIHGQPAVNNEWKRARIKDDPVKQANSRGTITFATSGKNSRTTQIFINYKDNLMLDKMGFAPFGEVVSGMDIVDSLYQGYGEGHPKGRGPNQGLLQGKGNVYLRENFPKLDYLESAEIVE